jgi:RNA recognition motif-containing protein
MKLYVGNLAFSVSEDELADMFKGYGEVASAKIIMDRASGRSKGFGFVEMGSREAGQQAIEALNGKMLQNRAIVVNEARPQTDRPRERGTGGFGGGRGGFGGGGGGGGYGGGGGGGNRGGGFGGGKGGRGNDRDRW